MIHLQLSKLKGSHISQEWGTQLTLTSESQSAVKQKIKMKKNSGGDATFDQILSYHDLRDITSIKVEVLTCLMMNMTWHGQDKYHNHYHHHHASLSPYYSANGHCYLPNQQPVEMHPFDTKQVGE